MRMQKSISPRGTRIISHWISIPLLVLALGLSLSILWSQTSLAARIAAARESRRKSLELASNPSLIESWMTFDYLNHIFALPPEYLKNTLSISDTRYPKLTLHSYAKRNSIAENAFLSEVKDAVTKHTR